MLENKLSRVGGGGWVGGGLLDQMKIRLTQPSFTETGAWAELGKKDFRHKEKSIAIIRTNQCRQTAMATNHTQLNYYGMYIPHSHRQP